MAFRVHNLKTEAGRKKKIAALVEMLKRGETIYPQGKRTEARGKTADAKGKKPGPRAKKKASK